MTDLECLQAEIAELRSMVLALIECHTHFAGAWRGLANNTPPGLVRDAALSIAGKYEIELREYWAAEMLRRRPKDCTPE
jgi:hypothetical protein